VLFRSATNDNTAATQFSVDADISQPLVSSIIVTPATLTDADVGAGALSIAVTFDETMNTAIAPTLGFPVEDPTNTISFTSSGWSGNALTYTAFYDVVDADEQIADIDIAVSGAEDFVGHMTAASTTADVFSIDMPGGAIVIEKVSVGGDDGFEFTSPEASLVMTLATTGGVASQTVSNLVPGSYDITEALSADFELTNLVCVDPDGGSVIDLSTRTATIDLDNQETVTCTFTNTSKGSITINQVVVGDDTTFDYAGDLGAFSIATSGGAGSEVFLTQTADTYVVTLAEVSGYSLTHLTCSGDTDNGSVTDLGARSVAIDLDAGETIACEFESMADPSISVAGDSTIALSLPKEILDPTTVSAIMPLGNTGGAPMQFSVSEDAPWLTVTPDSGAVPAGGVTDLLFSLTPEAGSLAAGTYSVNVLVTNESAVGGPQSMTVAVTVVVESVDGTITILTTTMPDIAGDATFGYSSNTPILDGLSLTTVEGTAISEAFTLRRGSYSLAQGVVEGWRIDSIVCVGDTDAGSVIDLEARSVVIDLDAAESMVCTFTNVRDEDYVRALTLRVIRSFMAERGDRILQSSPKIVDRLRNRGDATPGTFGANAADGRMTFNFATSLSGLRQSARDERVQYAALDAGIATDANPPRPEEDTRFDVWMQASFDHVESDRSGLQEEADFGIIHVGADFLASENLLIGGLIQIDYMDTTSGVLGSTVDGVGWMAGPYMVARISDNIYVDARGALGSSSNNVNPLGLYTDEFTTSRALFEAHLTGDYNFGALRVSPILGLAYFTESQKAYVDSLGISIPGQKIDIGRVTFGPEVAYRIDRGDGAFIEPFAELTAIWDYKPAEYLDAAGAALQYGDLRGSARVGLTARLRNGGTISVALNIDGIGDDDLKATGGELRLNVPFQ